MGCKLAVVIANGEHPPQRNIGSARTSAKLMCTLLQERQYQVLDDRVLSFGSAEEWRAIVASVAKFSAQENSPISLIFYYAGHGAVDADGLTPIMEANGGASDLVSIADVTGALPQECDAKIPCLFLLDCCQTPVRADFEHRSSMPSHHPPSRSQYPPARPSWGYISRSAESNQA
jgi:Caspase domain